MATDCYSIPSITDVFCIHLLAHDELRLYRTCKVIHDNHRGRREWWQHVKQLYALAFHTTPGMGQRSWDCFTVWRDCMMGKPLPEFPNDAALKDYRWPVGSPFPSPSEYSSRSESSDDISHVFLGSPQLAGSGIRGGPPCEQCGLLACVSRSETQQLICAKCLQGECIDQVISYWGNLHRNHRILSQPTIARNILEYMYGNGLAAYCYCGDCNLNWFLYGWVCRLPSDPPWPSVQPDRNNLAWRRSTRTPWWDVDETM